MHSKRSIRMVLAILIGTGGMVHGAVPGNLSADKAVRVYQRALKAIGKKAYEQAVAHLQTSLVAWPPKPDDAAQAEARYVPYLYLALCYSHMEQFEAAQAFYTLAQRRGKIYEYPDLGPVIDDVERNLGALERHETTTAKREPKPEGTDEQSGVDRRPIEATHPIDQGCRVEPAKDPYDMPWYFHYALGKDLLKRGRAYAALANFRIALDEQPKPNPKTRTYGMWFMEYRPYYYETKAFIAVGRKDCAVETARRSIRYSEVPARDPKAREWATLLRQLGLR